MIYCKNIVDMKSVFYSSRDFETTFFFFIFGNVIITIVKKKNLFPYFGNDIAVIAFFYFKSTPHSGTLGRTGLGKLGSGISAMPLPKFKDFLSPLSSFSLLLFGWISAMPLPKFSLSPQIPNYLWTVGITQINFEFYNINPKDSIVPPRWASTTRKT